MKSLSLAVLLALIVAPVSAQSSCHRPTAYASFSGAATAASGLDYPILTPARYNNGYGNFVTYLVTEQPPFSDTCDVTGAGTAAPSDHWVRDLCTTYKYAAEASSIFSSFSAAKAYAQANLTAFQREDTSVVQMIGGYVVVFPKIVELCER